MKKFIPLLFLASIIQANAANLTINGLKATVEDPQVITNIQKIASCSPKYLAKKSDYVQIIYLTVTKQQDLVAKYLIDKCVTLNNEDLKKQEAINSGNDGINFFNPMQFSNSQEVLLYMFTAQAPLDKVDGQELVFSLAYNPTNFNKKDLIKQEKFGEEGLNLIKKEISGKVPGATIDIKKINVATQKEEESYDAMLATLVYWKPESVRLKHAKTGNYLSHYFSYFARPQALKAVMDIEPASISLARINKLGNTPKMVAFRPYCTLTEKWQKESLLKTQMILIDKISSVESERKNGYGNRLPDYINFYLNNNDNKESNLVITNQIKKVAPNLLKNPKNKDFNYETVKEFCQN